MRNRAAGMERSRRHLVATGIIAATLAVAFAAHRPLDVSAQAPPVPSLSGIWHRTGPLDGRPLLPVQPTNRAAGFNDAFDDALNPTYDCSPSPVPALLADDYDFQIAQQADRVIMRYEKMDVVRTIWLEGHGHARPASNDYAIQGHSFGRYDGSSLVIETTQLAFDPRAFRDRQWIPGSTMRRVTERYWRDGDVLKLESVTEDPLTLRQPYRYDFEWTIRTDALIPYDCSPEDSRWGAQWHESKYPPDE